MQCLRSSCSGACTSCNSVGLEAAVFCVPPPGCAQPVLEDIVIRTYGEILYEDENKILIATERRLDKDISLPKYRYLGVIHKKLVIGRGK